MRALSDSGFSYTHESIRKYQNIVCRLPQEIRDQIFFLKANDKYFRPHLNPVGLKINTLMENEGQMKRFTDLMIKGKSGYFIIAAPST